MCRSAKSRAGLDVARLHVVAAGQVAARDDRIATASENGDAVPRFLTAPHRAVASLGKRVLRKFPVGRFKLLQADHVWLCRLQPGEQISKPLVDVVDVEGGDFHGARRKLACRTDKSQSALGHKQTLGVVLPMSALPPESRHRLAPRGNLRFVPIADMLAVKAFGVQ